MDLQTEYCVTFTCWDTEHSSHHSRPVSVTTGQLEGQQGLELYRCDSRV